MSKMYTEKEKMESALRLRRVREDADLSQEEFAEILGISASAYKKVERGENHVSLPCLKIVCFFKKSIRGTCTHLRCVTRQSLVFWWGQVLWWIYNFYIFR